MNPGARAVVLMEASVMDLPLWEPSDGQLNAMPFNRNYHEGDAWLFGHYFGGGAVDIQSCYYIRDDWRSELCFGYRRDIIEEDVLNEKSCVQVLRILMDKADDEILKLEEDVMMLQCQLSWKDEDWSKSCSATLREKIDHLDNLIQILKMEITKDVHYSDVQLEQPEELFQRLHDLVKPLLENYFAKIRQTQSSITQMSVLSTVGKECMNLQKLEEKECINMLKNKEGNSPSMEPEERKINDPQQMKDAIIRKCTADTHKGANYKLSKEELNKLNRLQGGRMPNSAPVKSAGRSTNKSEPSSPMVKDSSANTSIDKGGSREKNKTSNTDKEVISIDKTTQCRLELESNVTNSHMDSQETEEKIAGTVKLAVVVLGSQLCCAKQNAEASSQTKKARTQRHTINRHILSTKPLAEMERKSTKFPEKMEALEDQASEIEDSITDSLGLFNDTTEHAGKPNMKLESKIQSQQIHEINTCAINPAKLMSPLNPKGQGVVKNCQEAAEIVEQLCLAQEVEMESSSNKNSKGQLKFEVLEKIRKNGKKQIQQESAVIDGASEIKISSISSPLRKRKLSVSSKTIREKKGLRNFLIKLEKLDYDTPNSSTGEATANCGVKDLPQKPLVCIKDVERLSLNDLKTIAKNQKLPGYYKLRKAELLKRLGLQP